MKIEFKHGDLALEMINKRLQEITEELRELQPKTHGAVLLYLYDCGPGCTGCPHPRWTVWKFTNGKKNNSLFLGYKISSEKNPVRFLRRTGDFEKNFEEVKDLVLEAKLLIKYKKELLVVHKRITDIIRKIG